MCLKQCAFPCLSQRNSQKSWLQSAHPRTQSVQTTVERSDLEPGVGDGALEAGAGLDGVERQGDAADDGVGGIRPAAAGAAAHLLEAVLFREQRRRVEVQIHPHFIDHLSRNCFTLKEQHTPTVGVLLGRKIMKH